MKSAKNLDAVHPSKVARPFRALQASRKTSGQGTLSAPDSDVLSLTPKEAIVLLNLAQTSAHCTYDYLIDKLIGDSPRTTFDKVRLEVVISRLRSKLFKFKAQSFEIKTIHGTGYRLSKPLKLRPN